MYNRVSLKYITTSWAWTPITALILSSVIMVAPTTAYSNDIFMEQIGDNLDLTIVQKGGKNSIGKYDSGSDIEGDDMTIQFHQEHSHDGSGNNKIEYWHLDGKNGSVEVRQGSDNLNNNGVRSDSTEYSGHYARVDFHGDDNTIRVGQRNPDDSPHSATVDIWWADGVEVEVTQGSSGSKSASVLVRNDDSNISVLQHNNGSHSASISTYGSQPSTISLEQKGSNANSYSLTQDCQTTGGCSVSVTQQ